MRTRVTCYDCHEVYDIDERKRCECGEPLWFPVDEGFDWSETQAEPGVWRYADALPVDPSLDVGAASGGTPLLRPHRLDDYAGCRLFVKDEAENPTGSFKDRGSAVGVNYAAERDQKWVGTVSHGNMAMSMSAHAAGKGLNCVVLVPSRIPTGRLGLINQYDPSIVKVDGDYGQLYYDTLGMESASTIEFVNSDTPLRIEGQKTVGLEICESLAAETPDAITLPVSSGGHASAVWKGLRELSAAGAIAEIPRLYLIQAAACDPIAEAYRTGADSVSPTEPGETVAFSIANGSPPSGNRALTAARETGGAVISVPDDEIREAKARLAAYGGICAEPSSATALAGVRRLTTEGTIGADERVVAVNTGTGFKELGDDGADIEPSTITLAELESELAAIVQ
jgi:threonine synthase